MSFPSDLISPPQNTSMKPVIPPHRQPVAPPKVDASNGKNVGNDRTQVIKIIWCICIYIYMYTEYTIIYIWCVFIYIYLWYIYIYMNLSRDIFGNQRETQWALDLAAGSGAEHLVPAWTVAARNTEEAMTMLEEILAYTLWYIYIYDTVYIIDLKLRSVQICFLIQRRNWLMCSCFRWRIDMDFLIGKVAPTPPQATNQSSKLSFTRKTTEFTLKRLKTKCLPKTG